MNQVAIVIPIYRETLLPNEERSFRQTLRVLGGYPIVIVCPVSMDISKYCDIAGQFSVQIIRESFNDAYFQSIAGYNRLLLTEMFYLRFAKYEYMLIAQLDAYIFRDELSQWCAKGYDYIGAPLFGGEMNFEKAQVGNGGLSLRRVSAFLTYFRGKKNVVKKINIAKKINLEGKIYTRWFVWTLMVLGRRNKPCSFAEHYKYNEDIFWSITLEGTNYELRKPSAVEASGFAWERFPSAIYDQLGHLPFGCHAWEKYEYDTFWKQYID